nr:MAG: hypothetical protein [Lokiarchaeota virus Skoll Meg22_1214]
MIRVYSSHTAHCSGWDVDKIYEGTCFRKSCRTLNWVEEPGIKMLDWDYRNARDIEKMKKIHLEIVKNNDFELVMGMDAFSHNFREAIQYAEELKQYCDNVLIPFHCLELELLDHDLAYPNVNKNTKRIPIMAEFAPKIKHVLGGSPCSQIRLLCLNQKTLDGKIIKLKNVTSMDCNNFFTIAIRAGKYWEPRPPFWRKPRSFMRTEEIFKKSIHNFDKVIKNLELGKRF